MIVDFDSLNDYAKTVVNDLLLITDELKVEIRQLKSEREDVMTLKAINRRLAVELRENLKDNRPQL